METCCRCGRSFDVAGAREEYEAEYGPEFDGEDYDENYGTTVCANCSLAETDSNTNLGRAIQMMNGDEDYDADFIEQHL